MPGSGKGNEVCEGGDGLKAAFIAYTCVRLVAHSVDGIWKVFGVKMRGKMAVLFVTGSRNLKDLRA